MAPPMVAKPEGPAAEPSPEVLLRAAYGAEEFGKTGHSLAGHAVISEADVASVFEKGDGSNLLYGELLPEGTALLMEALFTQRLEQESQGPVLELGMGTGKVALHLFLTLHRDVYGVELAPSRWALADAALRKILEAAPERFSYQTEGKVTSRLADLASGACCEFVCGSLLDTQPELLARASAVVTEVCLPKDLQRRVCGLLKSCRAGCRAVCYAPLRGLVDGCRLAPVRPAVCREAATRGGAELGDGRGGLRLPASWRPDGHGFAFYELAVSPELAAASWAAAEAEGAAGLVEVDWSGNPARARQMRYTDVMLGDPLSHYPWSKGDRVLVGFSWLPFLDLGNPGDGSVEGFEGVTWMAAYVVSIDDSGYATICYLDDGTVEEKVHPERIRKEDCLQERPPMVIDWGED